MKQTLIQLGYDFVKGETINNREFKLVSAEYSIDEETSTFDTQRYIANETYELFLSYDLFTFERMKSIMEAKRKDDTDIDDISIHVDEQENGYAIVITTAVSKE